MKEEAPFLSEPVMSAEPLFDVYNLTNVMARPRQPVNMPRNSTNPAKNLYQDFTQSMNQTLYAK
jgi:hypothetical protein